ncbi:lethal(3)malignant brain tumor-like protein 4, partial [Tachysurus ichikawai]
VHFDGWNSKFDFWVDSDLPDLHPVGWCARTGHPLEPPLTNAGPSDLKSSMTQGVCPTPGCRGVGHIKGAKYTGHHSAFGCPYSDINMKKEVVLPDRLGGEKQITFVPVHFVQKTKRLCAEQEEEEVNDKESHEENREELSGCNTAPRPRGRPPSHATIKKEYKEEPSSQGQKAYSLLGKRSRLTTRIAQSTKYLRIKDEEEEEEEDLELNSMIPENLSVPENATLLCPETRVSLLSSVLRGGGGRVTQLQSPVCCYSSSFHANWWWMEGVAMLSSAFPPRGQHSSLITTDTH